MLLRGPEESEFEEIFRRFCMGKKLTFPSQIVRYLIDKHYRKTGKPMRRCHPRDILSHAIDHMHFEGLPNVLTEQILDSAFESCFVQENEEDDANYAPVVTIRKPMHATA